MATEYKPVTLPGCEFVIDECTGGVLSVHPVAALFPMMSDEELEDLVADIRANGLIHPIIHDADGVLIDGRNRLKACELAGVGPRYELLPPGADPVAFILSVNVARRHLTQGQKAMVLARSNSFKLKYWGGQVAAAVASKINAARISQASTILQYAPELVDAVMSAGKGLDGAYKEALDRKAAAFSVEARMARMRLEAPDLVDFVIEGRLQIGEAIAALDKRQREAEQARQTATTNLSTALLYTSPGSMTPDECATRWRESVDWTAQPHGFALASTQLRRSAAVLTALAQQLEEASDGNE